MILNKLAAGIVAVAIATTAISTPVKAKNNKELTTILALIAGGLVINEIVDRKKDRAKAPVVTPHKVRKRHRDTSIRHQHHNGRWYTHASMADLKSYHRNNRRNRDNRSLDLFHGNNHEVDQRPLKKHVKKLPMPQRCERTVRLHNGKSKRAYIERCLLKKGYKVDHRGVVSHRNWRALTRRPNLI